VTIQPGQTNSELYAIAVANEALLNQFLKGELQLQKLKLGMGALTVFVYTGASTAPNQGLTNYTNGNAVPIASGSGYDYETDINIWSRGAVSTSGSVTSNTTAIWIASQGTPIIPLAPGESITLRNKNPTQLTLQAAAAPSTTDTVIIYW
jgi:hypothetical protein